MAWNDITRAGARPCSPAPRASSADRPGWCPVQESRGGPRRPQVLQFHGNHALNQLIGLIDVACVLVKPTWKIGRGTRLSDLLVESVDAEGASNEQAVGYQLYNYGQYERARRHLVDVRHRPPIGLRPSRPDARVPGLCDAPDRTYAQLGDTDLQTARAIPDTIAEYAATAGASGPKTPTTVRRYAAGFLFARSGWGESRPFAEETYLTMRFGPGQYLHGQHDGQSITLSARGRRLLVDPGKYTYTPGSWMTYFESRAAHNVVVVDGLTYDARKATAIGTVNRPDRALCHDLEQRLRGRHEPAPDGLVAPGAIT